MKKRSYDEVIKILMLGESGVGKSSILTRFVDDKFATNFLTTLGVEYKTKLYAYEGKNVMLQMWDTAGQEKFRTITPIYYRKVDGIVVVFDITDQDSFDNINYWMKNLQDHTDPNLKIILVGNKSDLGEKRVVSQEDAEKLAASYNVPYIEASAKSRQNVSSVFVSLTKQILEYKKTAMNQSENLSMRNTTVEPTDINISVQLKKETSVKKKKDPKCLAKCCV